MNFNTVEQNFHKAAQQTGLLGTLFWWDLGQNRVDHSALERHADDAQLPRSFLPAEVKPTTAFRRAWRAAGRRLGETLLLREVGETPEHIIVAVVKEHPDVHNVDLRYEVKGKAAFHKRHETLTILAPDPDEILQGLPALFHHYKALTTEDIRAMVLGFVKKSGLSIRHAGGVYFIPPTLSDTLRALTDVLKKIGPNTVWSLPIANLGDAAQTLGSLANETLDAEITAVEQELARFDARGVDVRDSTLERRLKVFDELRMRTNLMAGALAFRKEALLEKLMLLEGDVKRRLVGEPLLPLARLCDADVPNDENDSKNDTHHGIHDNHTNAADRHESGDATVAETDGFHSDAAEPWDDAAGF